MLAPNQTVRMLQTLREKTFPFNSVTNPNHLPSEKHCATHKRYICHQTWYLFSGGLYLKWQPELSKKDTMG